MAIAFRISAGSCFTDGDLVVAPRLTLAVRVFGVALRELSLIRAQRVSRQISETLRDFRLVL